MASADRARTYQEQITGRSADQSYVVRGVRFDGYKNGKLLDAKSKYGHLIKEGDFQEWAQGTGKVKLVDQAQRQIKAARGVPIEWHVAQEDVAQVMRQLFPASEIGYRFYAWNCPLGDHRQFTTLSISCGAPIEEYDSPNRVVLELPKPSPDTALVGFFEAVGAERPIMLGRQDTGIRVGRFASLERRIDTGSRGDYGGRPGPRLRDAWPLEHVRSLDPRIHAPPEPDPAWP